MSQRLYNSLLLQLQGEGGTALALLEAQFSAAEPNPQKIIEHTAEINRCENALTVLQGYIGPRLAPPAAPAPLPAPLPAPVEIQEVAEKTSMVVDETRSPTFKRSKERREKLKKKKKDKSDD